MKIQLFIGEGWSPFQYDPNESIVWELPNADRLDVEASIEKLAVTFEEKVRDVYSDADVEVLPQASGGGQLVAVDLSDATEESVDDVLALTSEDLESDGFTPGAMIEGEIAGLLDGIIQERTNTWQVER
jgi:hypothetical protein